MIALKNLVDESHLFEELLLSPGLVVLSEVLGGEEGD